MTLSPLVSPFEPILNLSGAGLNAGHLYVGVAGSDPETSPQACFWDAAGTIAAAQPLDVLGGYVVRAGTPAQVYTAATYSMRARDRFGALVFYVANANPAVTVAGTLAYTPGYAGAEARTLGDKNDERISLLDFIPSAQWAAIRAQTSTYDASPDWTDAEGAISMPGSGAAIAGPKLFSPYGKYHFASTIVVHKTVNLEGDSANQPGNQNTVLDFPAATKGIRVSAYVASPLTTGGNGSIFKGLRVQGQTVTWDGTQDETAHGIQLSGQAHLSDLLVQDFPGDGVHVYAASGDNPVTQPNTYGNANGWTATRVSVFRSLNGITTRGSDANVGVIQPGVLSGNQHWGIDEGSALGNIYIGGIVQSNGINACASYGGHNYYTIQDNNVGHQPDISPLWWVMNDAAPSGSPWDVAHTYRLGGSVRAETSGVANNLFLGVYSESNQPPPRINAPSIVVGGTWPTNFVPGSSAPWINATATGLGVSNCPMGFRGYTSDAKLAEIMLGGGNAIQYNGVIRSYYHQVAAPDVWAERFNNNELRFDYAGSDSNVVWWITGVNTTWTFGRSVAQKYKWFMPDSLFVGRDKDQAINITAGDAAPTTGPWGRGDLCWNHNAAVGQPNGWRCTVAGTPGTWVAMANL